jgi:hypothetical protein
VGARRRLRPWRLFRRLCRYLRRRRRRRRRRPSCPRRRRRLLRRRPRRRRHSVAAAGLSPVGLAHADVGTFIDSL